MLEGVEAEIGKFGGFFVAENGEDAAFIVEMIVAGLGVANHELLIACSREPAQMLRRESTAPPIREWAFSLMMSSPRVTRSEERRVGKECSSRWCATLLKTKQA